MNLLAGVSFLTLERKEDFTINVEWIGSGWMRLDIGTPDNRYFYTASYITSALTDLIENAIFLLEHQKDKTIKPYQGSIRIAGRGCYMMHHELEPGFITWHFQPNGDNIDLLIWEDTDWDLLENITQYGYNHEHYELEPEKITELHKGLLFILCMPIRIFASIILETLNELEQMYTPEEYMNRWYSAYPQDLVDRLRTLAK